MARHVVRILICLVLGAATSVGVAWGLVIYGTPKLIGSTPQFSRYSDRIISMTVMDGCGVTIFRASTFRNHCGRTELTDKPRMLSTIPHWMEPQYKRFYEFMSRDEVSLFSANVVGAPFRCMRSEAWSIISRTQRDTPSAVRMERLKSFELNIPWFLEPTANRTGANGFQRTLPTGVQPIGMTANTSIYAAGWFLLLAAPRGLRCWRRSHRGLCARCGYDLHGVHDNCCPECGATLVHHESLNRK